MIKHGLAIDPMLVENKRRMITAMARNFDRMMRTKPRTQEEIEKLLGDVRSEIGDRFEHSNGRELRFAWEYALEWVLGIEEEDPFAWERNPG